LIPALYKTFGISLSVKYLLKKKTKTNGVPRGTLKDKKNQLFNLKVSLVFALSTFFDISLCTLVLVSDFILFLKKNIIMFYYCFVQYFYWNNQKNLFKKID